VKCYIDNIGGEAGVELQSLKIKIISRNVSNKRTLIYKMWAKRIKALNDTRYMIETDKVRVYTLLA